MGACNSKRESFVQNIHVDYHDYCIPIENYEKVPLVSLEIAVEPLISLLPSIQNYVHLVKQKCVNPADDLTQDESASIMLCTIKWQPFDQCLSLVLNTILCSTDREQFKPWLLYLKLLLTALCRLPSVHRTVYRGIKSDVSKQYLKDKTIIWRDVCLCTTSIDLLQSDKYLGKQGRRTIFTIQCNSSKDITKHSYYTSLEMILLLPATQFKVMHCLKQKSNLYWIQLKEIPSSCNFLQSEFSRNLIHVDSIPMMIPSLETNQSCNYKSTTINDRYYNGKLEQLIAQYPLNSSIQIKTEQLSNCDMKIIVQQAIIDKQCRELWLSNTQITSQDALILSNGLYNNKRLTKLYLNDNCINDRGVHALARVLSINNSTLKELYLARNGITSTGALYLSEMLNTNRTLTTLCLFGNQIDDNGIRYLTHVLTYYNTTLEYLYLSGNIYMTDISIGYFIRMLQENQSLKKLHLFNCNFTQQGKNKTTTSNSNKKFFCITYVTK